MTIIEKAMQSAAARKSAPAPAEPAPPRPPRTRPAAPAPEAAAAGGDLALFSRLADGGMLLDRAALPAMVGQLRHLKLAILKCAFGPLAEPGANVVMLSSPMPGAGKTWLAANLGQMLALERDRSILLIDADNTRGTLTRALKLKDHAGFYDLLHDESLPVESCTLATEYPGLSVLPTGGAYQDSLELLNSQRASELVEQLTRSDPNRLLLLDCPPLLATPDAAALSMLAGQILMVVEAGITSEDSLDQALALLDSQKPIGLVLNKIPNSRLLASSAGYYYYSYGYGERPDAPAVGGNHA